MSEVAQSEYLMIWVPSSWNSPGLLHNFMTWTRFPNFFICVACTCDALLISRLANKIFISKTWQVWHFSTPFVLCPFWPLKQSKHGHSQQLWLYTWHAFGGPLAMQFFGKRSLRPFRTEIQMDKSKGTHRSNSEFLKMFSIVSVEIYISFKLHATLEDLVFARPQKNSNLSLWSHR